MELFDNEIKPEIAVLVSIDTGEFDAELSLLELEELSKTAGADVHSTLMQKREKPNAATYLGSGRLQELKEICEENEINLLIFDCELSPSQQRNIEDITDIKVIDRTTLILDIFAKRANSSEGKLQVELAQLKYSLPRLTGKGTELSRLGGGIGTRGPGETKLESDRRHIRRRIKSLENELVNLQKRRGLIRNRRKKDGIISVAIVGYTNSGKSTLLNALTDAGVLAENMLFATLDPTARALMLPDGREVMLIDTVGLIRRLPHNLVEAFKSTLEEAVNADIILNVCDASSPECSEHLAVTLELLKELKCEDKTIISVMNKCDLIEDLLDLQVIGTSVMISALEAKGLDKLLETIQNALPNTRRKARLLFPYSKAENAAKVRKDGVIISEEFKDEGQLFEAIIDYRLLEELKEYIIE